MTDMHSTSWFPLPPDIRVSSPLWIMTDAHGRYNSLKGLLDKKPAQAQFVFLGDACDRGSRNYEVIDELLHRDGIYLWGNHDAFAYAWFQQAEYGLDDLEGVWIGNGMLDTVKSWLLGVRKTLISRPDEKRDVSDAELFAWIRPYFERLRRYVRIGQIVLSHAGLPCGRTVDTDQWFERADPLLPVLREQSWLWHRPDIGDPGYGCAVYIDHTPCLQIFGHTPVNPEYALTPYALALDFGYDTLAALEIVPESGIPDSEINNSSGCAMARYHVTVSDEIQKPRRTAAQTVMLIEQGQKRSAD